MVDMDSKKNLIVVLFQIKNNLLELYCFVGLFIIPLTIVGILYVITLVSVRRSTRRVQAFTENIILRHNTLLKSKRELKIIKKLFYEIGIVILAGFLTIFIITWHFIHNQLASQPLYLISLNITTVVIFLKR